MLLVSELKLWGDLAQGLLGFMLAGNSAGRLGDTLSRLVRTGQRTLDRVGATLGSLMRAHEAQATASRDCWAMCWLGHSERRRILAPLCP